jgi:predicted RNase H-like HicB family nuclease
VQYGIILSPEPQGGFTITMPAFPDYAGFADAEDEAVALAREGVAFEIERLRERGQPPPTEAAVPKVLVIAA